MSKTQKKAEAAASPSTAGSTASVNSDSVMGIYLHAGETFPRLISVLLEEKFVQAFYTGQPIKVSSPILPPLLGPGGEHAFDSLPIDSMGYRGRELEQPFKLYIRDNFLNDGSPRNMIPSTLTSGKAPHRWAGNLLALKETSQNSGVFTDCTLQDLGTLIKYFEWYGDIDIQRETAAREMAQFQAMFPGVKIVSVDLNPTN